MQKNILKSFSEPDNKAHAFTADQMNRIIIVYIHATL